MENIALNIVILCGRMAFLSMEKTMSFFIPFQGNKNTSKCCGGTTMKPWRTSHDDVEKMHLKDPSAVLYITAIHIQ
jgi:hypothetical protein